MGDKSMAASEKQLAYVRRLRRMLGTEQPESDYTLTTRGASVLIDELKQQLKGETPIVAPEPGMPAELNQPRLGMVMKECFRYWRGKGYDVFDDKNRQKFIEDVLKTYALFSEIADRAAAD